MAHALSIWHGPRVEAAGLASAPAPCVQPRGLGVHTAWVRRTGKAGSAPASNGLPGQRQDSVALFAGPPGGHAC